MPLKQGVGKKMTQCFQSACSMSGMCTPPHPMANIHLAYILMAIPIWPIFWWPIPIWPIPVWPIFRWPTPITITWCHEKSESWHFYHSEVAMHGSFVPLMTNIKAKVKNSQQCARSLTWCHEKSESWHFDHSTLSIFRFYIYKVNIPEIRSTYQK